MQQSFSHDKRSLCQIGLIWSDFNFNAKNALFYDSLAKNPLSFVSGGGKVHLELNKRIV